MRTTRLRWFVSIAVLGIVGGGCGSGTATGGASGSGTGGAFATGGTNGTGGTTGSGGSSNSGGVGGKGSGGSTGGTTGTGGATSTGGTTGTGGATSTGGATGAGGTTGTGGAPSTGGATGSAGRTGGGGMGNAGAGGTVTGSAGSHGGAGGGSATPSAGCGHTPTLKSSSSATANQNTLTISGASRQFLIRWPTNYDNTQPYRLILDFHGAGGKDTDLAPTYFGVFNLANNSTIFVAPSAANGGIWDSTTDTAFVDEILKTVEGDLCIDTSRVELEGFSQGGAMVAVLACGRPGVFRAAVGHSRGGLTAPTTCQPIPYLGSLGLSDVAGNSQATQTDAFAKWDGCTIKTLPTAPTGGHVCTAYTGCIAADPVIWCSFDGPHTASPTDSGQSASWMPAVVWPFLSQF
jgi:poly(3-hydroxybutyrate) depolymerase